MSSVLSADPPGIAPNLDDAPLLNPRAQSAGRPPRLSIILPSRNEQLTIGPLLCQLAEVFAGQQAEVLIIDDSETPDCAAAARAAAADLSLPVRMLVRPVADRRGGLATAVLDGFRRARGEWILVMDSDLQHPPEAAAGLAAAALGHDYDLVVGTRYAGAGSAGDGLDGPVRVAASRAATRLARTLFPRRLGMITDPLSGLFALRRAAVDPDRLNPTGFKILLEILVRHPRLRVAEVSYRFEARPAGGSNANVGTMLSYLRHLARLRGARLNTQLRQGPAARGQRLAG